MLSGQQRALYEALLERSARLAEMYLGAVQVLASDNPVRHSLAAHGFRELMDHAPRYLAIRVPDKPAGLKVKVIELRDQWNRADRRSAAVQARMWVGDIDHGLGTFLAKAAAFFEWFSGEFSVRKERTGTLLSGLDPLRKQLPPVIANLRIEEWDSCHDFFTNAAHHGSAEGFDGWLDRFERFLLDHLRPRTYGDRAVIDAIIEEGERDA